MERKHTLKRTVYLTRTLKVNYFFFPNLHMMTFKENDRFQPIRNNSHLSKVLKDFCDSTSLHGYGYLYNVDSILMKLVWGFVILTMAGLGLFFFVKHTKEYHDSTIITTIETSSASLDVSHDTIFIPYLGHYSIHSCHPHKKWSPFISYNILS